MVTNPQCARRTGSTSCQAAEALGYKDVYYPEDPGIDGFVDAIMTAYAAQRREQAAAH